MLYKRYLRLNRIRVSRGRSKKVSGHLTPSQKRAPPPVILPNPPVGHENLHPDDGNDNNKKNFKVKH